MAKENVLSQAQDPAHSASTHLPLAFCLATVSFLLLSEHSHAHSQLRAFVHALLFALSALPSSNNTTCSHELSGCYLNITST